MKKILGLVMVFVLALCLGGCTKNLKSAKLGDTVEFGKYEKKPIEWIVVDENKDSKEKLLLSSKILFCMVDEGDDKFLTWGTGSIRKFLNKNFLDDYFTKEECSKIVTKEISTEISMEDFIGWMNLACGKRFGAEKTKETENLWAYRQYRNSLSEEMIEARKDVIRGLKNKYGGYKMHEKDIFRNWQIKDVILFTELVRELSSGDTWYSNNIFSETTMDKVFVPTWKELHKYGEAIRKVDPDSKWRYLQGAEVIDKKLESITLRAMQERAVNKINENSDYYKNYIKPYLNYGLYKTRQFVKMKVTDKFSECIDWYVFPTGGVDMAITLYDDAGYAKKGEEYGVRPMMWVKYE